jgi:hypothetical protein
MAAIVVLVVSYYMGRTIPSFRIALAMEEEEPEWKKPFRNALDKSDRKKFLMRCVT